MTSQATSQAIIEALDFTLHPAKAEQFFYLLKALADPHGAVSDFFNAVHLYFSKQSAYKYMRQLEMLGAVERIVDENTDGTIIGVKILQEEIAIKLYHRGKKSAATKEEELPVDMASLQETVPLRTVIFIDENALIRSEEKGIEFNFDAILQRTKQGIGGEIVRAFVYFTETTERKSQSAARKIFGPDNPLIRYVKTGSQKGVVDKRIKEDMILWSQSNLVTVVALATADGGPDFQEAIAAVKKSGKKFALLEVAATYNQTLRKLADMAINATPENPHKRTFQEIVLAMNDGNFEPSHPKSRFVAAVARGAENFFCSTQEGQFMLIVQHIHNLIITTPEFEQYTFDDVREALNALVKKGEILRWRKSGERDVYFPLTTKSLISELLDEKGLG